MNIKRVVMSVGDPLVYVMYPLVNMIDISGGLVGINKKSNKKSTPNEMGKTMFQCNPVKTSHDEYYTRKSHWSDIQECIPRDKVIWESFMLNSVSKSPIYLQELGFDVEWDVNEDIFTQKKRDDSIIVSNLPFSVKKEIFQHLKEIDQPFIILAPSTCLHTKYFNEIFSKEKIQLIIPSTKRNFDKYVDGIKVDGPSNCSFYTLYICYKAGLDNDVNFI